MKLLLPFAILCAFSLFAPPAYAGASGVLFTDEEIAANLSNATAISETAAACIKRVWNIHKNFYQKRKYSKFYGSRRPEYKTEQGRKTALMRILPELGRRVRDGERDAIAELDAREKELETTSCIGLAVQCLGEGFQNAGMDATWGKIRTWIARPGADGEPLFYGTDLQKALVDLGWKSIYWNPDISQNQAWDELEKAFNPLAEGKVWNPIWGGHAYRWAMLMKNRDYYGIPVHDISTLVNFGINPTKEFKKPPFFLGTAHAGYHVFPGFHGQIIEAHSMRELKAMDNMEVGDFNPLFQPVNGVATGNGAPRWTRSEHYRSGVIVVPPGYISDKPFEVPGPAVNVPPNGTVPPPPTPVASPVRPDPGSVDPRWDEPEFEEPRRNPNPLPWEEPRPRRPRPRSRCVFGLFC